MHGEHEYQYGEEQCAQVDLQYALGQSHCIIYINDDLQRAVDGIDIRPEDFREIARKRYKITLDMLGEMENREMRRKNVIRLTESDLHRIIRESVNRVLKQLI